MIETPSDNLGADDEISMFMLENAWMGIPVVLRRYTIRREVNMCGITADQYSVSKSLWKGYERNDFTLDGREALIVNPITIADGNPWIWRTEFFDAFAQADMAMLEKGWHLAYYKVSDMYGSPEAIKN